MLRVRARGSKMRPIRGVYGFCDGAALVAEYRPLFSDRQIPRVFIRDAFGV